MEGGDGIRVVVVVGLVGGGGRSERLGVALLYSILPSLPSICCCYCCWASFFFFLK